LPEKVEVEKLTGLLAEAEKGLAEATASHAAAEQLRKTAWQEGTPADVHERAEAAAARKLEACGMRLAHLRNLLAATRTKADKVAAAAVREARTAVIDDLTRQRAQALAALHAAIQAPLAAVLSVGLVLDSLYPG
jgi:hypothetical protein